MITLLNQEFAVEAYGAEEKRNGIIIGMIQVYQEFNATMEEAAIKLVEKYDLSYEKALELVKENWKQPTAV